MNDVVIAPNGDLSRFELFTVSELASLLKISERSVWRLVSTGKIPSPMHVGRLARWRYRDIEVWMERQNRQIPNQK